MVEDTISGHLKEVRDDFGFSSAICLGATLARLTDTAQFVQDQLTEQVMALDEARFRSVILHTASCDTTDQRCRPSNKNCHYKAACIFVDIPATWSSEARVALVVMEGSKVELMQLIEAREGHYRQMPWDRYEVFLRHGEQVARQIQKM